MAEEESGKSKVTHLHSLNPSVEFNAEIARTLTKTAGIIDLEKYCSECNENTDFNVNGHCMKCMERAQLSEKEVLAIRAVVYEFNCPECDCHISVGEEDLVIDNVNEHECCCCHSIIKFRCSKATLSQLK